MNLCILVLVASSSLCALVASLVNGRLTALISVCSLLFGFAVSWWIRDSEDEQSSVPSLSIFSITSLFLGLIFLGGFFQFLYLVFEVDGHYVVGNPNNLGDLALHISYIRSFARGLSFWPQNTEFSGEILKYPFGMDLWNALFESIGVPLRAHLFVTGVMGFWLLLVSLYKRAGQWAVAAFFLSGGFAGWNGLVAGIDWGPSSSIDWKNLFLAVFVTQRGFLFALPAGLWLLQKLEHSSLRRKDHLAICLLWGSLAFFHLHSFLFLSLYLGFRIIIRGQLRQYLWLLVAVIALASPFLYQSILQGKNLSHSLGLSWGWTYGSRKNEVSFLHYFLQNFGVLMAIVPLVVYAGLRQGRSRRNEIILLSILALLFFNFRVATWSWDNVKVLLWVYLIFQFEFYDLVIRRLQPKWQWALIVVVFLPGIFQWAAGFPARGGAARFSPSIATSECKMKLIHPDDVIIASNEYDHPLYFQGGSQALGFEGHVWSHGYDVSKRKALVDRILARESGWPRAAKELNAKWVVWGHNEKSRFTNEWDSSQQAFSECEVQIYDLSKHPEVISEPSIESSIEPNL